MNGGRRSLAVALALSAASGASGFAGLGLALYAGHPQALAAVVLFAAFGAVGGAAAFGLPRRADALPAQARLAAGLPAGDGRSNLQRLAERTLATVQQSARDAAAEAPSATAAPSPQPAAAETTAEH